MIVSIVGSRDFPRLELVSNYVERIARKYPNAVIVSGGALGVDRKAEETARALGLGLISYRPYEYENMYHKTEFSIETVTIGEEAQSIVVEKSRRISPPFFKTYAGAAFHRNGWIVDDGTVVIAFQFNNSNGTGDSITKARKVHKLVDLVVA